MTLTAYDSSNAVLDTDAVTPATAQLGTLSVSSTVGNIKYFTLGVNDPAGLGFSNIVWGCAS